MNSKQYIVIIVVALVSSAVTSALLQGVTGIVAEEQEGSKEIKIVRAQCFELVSDKGKVLAKWGVGSGPSLIFFGENGKKQIAIEAAKDHPSINLYDSQEDMRYTVMLSKDQPYFGLWDSDNNVRLFGGVAVLEDGETEAPAIGLNDENRTGRVTLAYVKEEGPTLKFDDAKGELIKCYPDK